MNIHHLLTLTLQACFHLLHATEGAPHLQHRQMLSAPALGCERAAQRYAHFSCMLGHGSGITPFAASLSAFWDCLDVLDGGANRSRIWEVPIDPKEALSVLTTALATSSLKRCRPMMRSSRVPLVSRRYTFTVRFWPSLCALSIACAQTQAELI